MSAARSTSNAHRRGFDPAPADPGAADHAATDALRQRWLTAWPRALAAWGRHLRLRAPHLVGPADVPADVASFAWFSTRDVEVFVDLEQARALGLAGLPVEVLAHEIGHHVLSPGDLATAGRLLVRARAGLVDRVDLAPVVANLWSDLLINDRLQRRAELRMGSVWRAIGPPHPDDVVMQLVMRTDELLWALPAGTLTCPDAAVPEREAQLCARAVRAYADDPVGGVGGFGALVRQLLADRGGEAPLAGAAAVVCAHAPADGGAVPGLASDPTLAAPAVHPALDPRVVRGLAPAGEQDPDGSATPGRTVGTPTGDDGATSGAWSPTDHPHGIDPAEYAAVLAELGVQSDPARAAAAWYRENAAPYLVPFPTLARPVTPEPLLGGLETWDAGDDLAAIDWPASLAAGPRPVPGFTLVRRVVEEDDPAEPGREPVDLDLYLDSSGSIPDPCSIRSPLALAGTVLALSALRAGARVRATTWSGPDQVAGTDGFTERSDDVLAAVVAHFGGGTSFPLEHLAAAHPPRTGDDGGHPTDRPEPHRRADPRHPVDPDRRPCHIAVISDAGVDTMFRTAGVAVDALAAAGGGGTLVLQTSADMVARIREMAAPYAVHRVADWEDLVDFARAFAARMWDVTGAGR
ncbi:hypothetical protein [Georgenia thermotolerans]|uniref:VWA domain-containing protein n=1 Tax=Georgenia thermotolerans TaxID=527326 RepID=A0A7J5UIT2_9MICO|nr:hypothetical protein [Georgenia thermotolerans]KAE8762295.1 hypothetical protein GB883_20080 [Georgenia thermotolerans]